MMTDSLEGSGPWPTWKKRPRLLDCWKEAHSGAQAAGTLATGVRETEGHLTHSMNNRDATMASTGSKVIGLPGISGP